MIEMRVRQQNRLDVQTIPMDAIEELVDFIAGSIITPARVCSQETTYPFLKKGGTAAVTMRMSRSVSYHRPDMREPINLTIGRRRGGRASIAASGLAHAAGALSVVVGCAWAQTCG